MLKWWKVVIDDLFKPSPQKGDWYGWTTNQIGHTFLGIFAFWAILFLGFHAILAFFVPILIMLIKETIDLLKGGSSVWDGFTDFSFVLFGVFFGFFTFVDSGNWFFITNFIMSTVLIYGIRKRVKEKENEIK